MNYNFEGQVLLEIKIEENIKGGNQRIIFEKFSQISKSPLHIKLILQFCKLDFLHNLNIRQTQLKLDLKG